MRDDLVIFLIFFLMYYYIYSVRVRLLIDFKRYLIIYKYEFGDDIRGFKFNILIMFSVF